jgi:phosphotransferase system enzyme I (PtsI)
MFKGMGVSAGIGLGKIVILHESELQIERKQITDTKREWKCYQNAVESLNSIARLIAEKIRKKLDDKQANLFLEGMNQFCTKQMLKEVESEIFKNYLPAEVAVEDVVNRYCNQFGYDAEKCAIFEDIKKRIQKILLGIEEDDLSKVPKGSILVTKELSPVIAAELKASHIEGIVTEMGGSNSHSAIIARMLEIPAVFGIVEFMNFVKNGDSAIIDGSDGTVYVNPREVTYLKYQKKKNAELEEKKRLEDFANRETKLKDGQVISLYGNIEKISDIYKVLENGADGVGLFRTEFLFVDRSTLPNEDEQFEVYREAAVVLNGKPLVIRTLDVGGDKEIQCLGLEKESNPFLGYRAIRFSLGRMDIFQTQIRAILRASAYGHIQIMIPMVTSIEELRRAKTLINLIREDLEFKGIAFDRNIQVGVMIETPAAALLADIFAKESDFLSIGTNDLIQYTIAVDRSNQKVSYLYTNYHPAVIRSIRNIIKQAKASNKRVSICGEMAGDEKIVPLLLAFGLEEFSVRASLILRIRKSIVKWDREQLASLEEKILQLDTAEAIEKTLEEFL